MYIYTFLKNEWKNRIARAVLKSKNQLFPIAWCLDRKTRQKQRWATLRASLLPPALVLGKQLASQPLHLSAPLTPTAPAGNRTLTLQAWGPYVHSLFLHIRSLEQFTWFAQSSMPRAAGSNVHLCSPSLHKL